MIQQVEVDEEVDDHEWKEAEAVFAIQLRQFQEERKQNGVPKVPGSCSTCGSPEPISTYCPHKGPQE